VADLTLRFSSTFRIKAEQLADRAIKSYRGKSINHSTVDAKQPEPDLCAKASIIPMAGEPLH
jgi:hypothetical protein